MLLCVCFIFGKKGAGKSCYMVHEMLRYMKRGYHVYTDMADCRIPGVRIISVDMLSSFRPEPNSALFLDEVGISMDNRNFKSFPPGLRDFFKYLRKMKCVCYLNSQAFDVDKKVRDTIDKMVLQVALLGCFSLSRPIIRSITLTESTSQADSRIADNLRFSTIWTWRIFYMPRRCLKIDDVSSGEGFFRQTRRFDAEILCVFQVKSTTYGGKRLVVWVCWQFSNEP